MHFARVVGIACILSATARAEGPIKEKVFISPVRGEKISKDVVSTLFDFVVIAVDRAKVMRVVTMDDVNSILDQENRKDAIGCSSISCAVALGGALGVRYLLATRVKKLGSELIFTASLIDTVEQESKNGQGKCPDDLARYQGAVDAAVAEALGLVQVDLKAGKAVASKPEAEKTAPTQSASTRNAACAETCAARMAPCIAEGVAAGASADLCQSVVDECMAACK